MPTAFHEVLFPLDIALRSAGGPERRTEIVALGSGHEERNTRWAHSRRRYDAGYGATADTTNPLSAKLNNALWIAKTAAEGGTGDLRYKLSKENAGKTLSLLLQNNFSGRAEMGLTGDDDFHFKVSPNGSTWFEGIRIDRNTGKVSFPVSGGPREVLAANRTYYVRTDGSDANTGLANTSGGAFLTIQKAIDTVAALDLAAYSVTIQVGNGTYGGLVAAKSYVGAGPVTIVGDETTPSNVTISSATGTSGTAVLTFDTVLGKYVVKGLKLTSSVSGQHGLYALNGSIVDLQNVDFGALNGGWHMLGAQGGQINTVGNYKISGGAAYHVVALQSGSVSGQSITVTLTGAPAFTSAFARATRSGTMKSAAITYSGAATGPRYFAEPNGVVYTAGGGPNYFPGDSAGSAATGGQYV
jgi:hypothetical protein